MRMGVISMGRVRVVMIVVMMMMMVFRRVRLMSRE